MALADDKAAAIAQAYSATRDRINQLTVDYSAFEMVAWSLKLSEARAILNNQGHQGLLLAEAEATLRFSGIAEPTDQQIAQQLIAMAQGIISAADQLMAAEAALVGWRSATKNRIDQAGDAAALSAISLLPPI